MGVQLHQGIGGVASSLALFSRRLAPTEQRYIAYDRELLAIYLAVKHGKHLSVPYLPDQKPLVHL